MGVPITFLDKYNPEQFEIIGLDRYTVPPKFLIGGRVAINGKPRYARILIRRRKSED
ncbi:MAG: adenine-specific methyltransferase EcoRI family protein [Eubacteriales bacterium]|nr:adenine-specific methyltransferase EcoRI family protein [Eubacteriales bacterium]